MYSSCLDSRARQFDYGSQFTLIVPEHAAFARNIIDALIFHAFVLFVHYKREAVCGPLRSVSGNADDVG